MRMGWSFAWKCVTTVSRPTVIQIDNVSEFTGSAVYLGLGKSKRKTLLIQTFCLQVHNNLELFLSFRNSQSKCNCKRKLHSRHTSHMMLTLTDNKASQPFFRDLDVLRRNAHFIPSSSPSISKFQLVCNSWNIILEHSAAWKKQYLHHSFLQLKSC